MGFFSTAPKRVTKEEFKEIMSNLYGKLEATERIEVEKLFRADLDEPGVESGISQLEFDTAIVWLQENKNKHVLEDDDIALVTKYFEEHLKD
jgi:Flp pilus assembly CpaE family ATPase